MQMLFSETSEQKRYRCFDDNLRSWVSFRCLNMEDDLPRFNRWQNCERVARFWDQRGSLEQHQHYLAKLTARPHVIPLIGCIDDDPFLYLEVYWAKKDRLSAHYAASENDLGIHMLVGEERHRGPHKVKAWLSALCRYLFEDSFLTQRIVSEPRYDNLKMIEYLQKQGFDKIREFNFPHKRAALMLLTRDCFFKGRSS